MACNGDKQKRERRERGQYIEGTRAQAVISVNTVI